MVATCPFNVQSFVAAEVEMLRGDSHSADSTMMHHMTWVKHPADRLCEAIDRVGVPLCVGIDPVVENLPRALQGLEPIDAFRAFCTGIIDVVNTHAAVVKFQSATGVSTRSPYRNPPGDVAQGDLGLSSRAKRAV